MKKMLFGSIGLLLVTQTFALGKSSMSVDPNSILLPSPFPVYVIENTGVINHPYPGAVRALLPTDNSYTSAPGCYIACYSHKPGVYSVSPSISVIGQIRVGGEYAGRICQPEGYKERDISAIEKFKHLCGLKFHICNNDTCWAGGDTGGWFGIQ